MNVRLLGTGAAEGIPGLFADSPISLHAREHGGKDIRSRSGALIDDQLKIDFPPDVFHQANLFNLNPRDWIAIVFTHSHDDHFSLPELQYGLHPFTKDEFPTYAIYGNDVVISKIEAAYPAWPLDLNRTCSFAPFQIAEYSITPVAAYHKLDEDSQNLLIESGGKSLLYATDTGVWREPTWDFLVGRKLDGLVIECTDGIFRTSYHGHLGIDDMLGVVERLRSMGVVHSGTRVATTHHGHWGGLTHAQLELALEPHGIAAGFDGLVLEL